MGDNMNIQTISASDKIANSRVILLKVLPFFGIMIHKTIWESVPNIATACTDGKKVFWSPSFFDGLSKPESSAVMLHEMFHVVLNHPVEMLRFMTKNPQYNSAQFMELINIAMDYVINLKIKDMQNKWITLPENALLDEKYRGMHWVEVFKILVKDQQPDQGNSKGNDDQGDDSQDDSQGGDDQGDDSQGDSQDDSQGGDDDASQGNPSDQSSAQGEQSSLDFPKDKGGMGGVMMPTNDDGSEPSESDLSKMEEELKVIIEQAEQLSRKKGDQPSHITELAKNSKKSKVDWAMILRKFVAPVKPKLQSFNRLNKKYSANGIKMPSTRKSGVAELSFGIDTSLSTPMSAVEQSVAEMQKVCNQIKPDKITIHWFTSRVWQTDTYKSNEKFVIPTNFERGGTCFQSLFDAVEKQESKPKALVVLTDLECNFPEKPKHPVLWISTQEGKKAPYGTTTYLDAVA